MGTIAIALTFTISTSRIYMVFITQAFYYITRVAYYLPHEVAIMNSNKRKQMGKFVGINNSLILIAICLGSLVSGFISDYSYFIIFAMLLMLSVGCILLSFSVNIVKEDMGKYGLTKFIKATYKVPKTRYAYISNLFFNLCNDGVVASFLPILIFMRTGTNFSVGIYSALANLVAGIVLILYCYFCKNKKLAMWLSTIFQVLVSISIIIWNSIVVFFIYYFVKMIALKIIKNGLNQTLFSAVHNTVLEPYKAENYYTYNLYNYIGKLTACIVSLIVYNIMHNVVAIAILLAGFSLTQIFGTILLNKSDAISIYDDDEKNNHKL